jgi:predicted Zn-ribbon and HTH transcriptional regulator
MVDIKKCKKCGHEWTARIEKIKMCPRCKSYNWEKEIKNGK